MNRLISPTGHVLPASEGTLVYFASYLARTVRHSTIKLYLAAARNLHITAGYNDPLESKLLLRKVLRGILRFQGEKKIRRQPVTPPHAFINSPRLAGVVKSPGFFYGLGRFYFSVFCLSSL